MRKNVFYFALCILTFAFCNKLIAQDIHFSQYYANPLNMNPSLAGSLYQDGQAVLTYKDQWAQLDNPYKTYAFSADAGFMKNRGMGFWGAGLNLFQDISGVTKLTTTVINLTGSYHVRLNNVNHLTAGIQGGIIQKKINAGNMQWDSQYDGMDYNAALSSGENFSVESFILGDASFGLVWNYQSQSVKNSISNEGIKSELGVAFFHVNKPEYSFLSSEKDKLNPRFVVHGKASVNIPNSIFALIPTFIYTKQGISQELLFGGYCRMMSKDNATHKGFLYTAAVSVGAHYRNKDALIFSMLLEKAHFALGISYDVNTSSLKYATNKDGGLEVTLRYTTPNPFAYRRSGNSLL